MIYNCRSYVPSLEIEFENEHIREVDVTANCEFEDFLSPNEKPPEEITEHLYRSLPGITVSTGTERSFFNLIFCDETKCEGIVIRDINPRVKAYVDFNTALIRISKTCEEYSEWSQTLSKSTQILKTIQKIKDKIAKVDMPSKIKEYYLKNAIAFGKVYLRTDKSWRTQENFKESFYHQNDDQFYKIKRYIETGNFISTIGEINDLQFLKNRNIAIVDTSNILAYSLLNLEGGNNFHPRVIWTDISTVYHTKYYSYVHSSLNKDEKDSFKDLIAKMRSVWRNCNNAKPYKFHHWVSLQLRKFDLGDDFSRDVGSICSMNTLRALEKIMAENSLERWPSEVYPNKNRAFLATRKRTSAAASDGFNILKRNKFLPRVPSSTQLETKLTTRRLSRSI